MNLNTIFLVAALFGFLLVFMLLLKKSVNRTATLFLTGFYLFISVLYLHAYVINSGLLTKMTWFFAWPLQFYSLIPVLIFFYFVTSFNDRFQWKPIYLLLFIPWLISLIDVLQFFFFKSSDFRAVIIQKVILNPENRFNLSYGFLRLNIHFLIKNIEGLILMAVLLPSLIRFMGFRINDKNKQLFNFWLLMLWILFTLQSFVWLIYNLSIAEILPIVFSENRNQSVMLFISVIILLMGITPLYFPSILYGFPIYENKQESVLSIHTKATKQYAVADLETGHRYGFKEHEIAEKLKEIEMQQLFLSPDFDIAALAQKMELPIHHVSYFLNKYHETNFATYRNKLRMEYAVQLINDKYLDHNTIEALAWACGFASRTSFSKNFKTVVGFSPKEYHEKLISDFDTL
jgi:AraC-like DNA-binding protein